MPALTEPSLLLFCVRTSSDNQNGTSCESQVVVSAGGSHRTIQLMRIYNERAEAGDYAIREMREYTLELTWQGN